MFKNSVYDIPADNIERAKKFYKSVFGWKINDVPQMDYNIIHTVATDNNMMPKVSGVINGGMMKRMKDEKSPVIVIDTKNLDKELNKVKEHGGELVTEKMKVGDIGYYAYVKDTKGNTIGIFESTKT